MLHLFNEDKLKAIAYYRFSAEDKQENSIEIQRTQAEQFASNHDIEIIHEEIDEGKSGLLAARPGFEHLFNDWVLNPQAPKSDCVFVLNVSRWGRFQDTDEGAYWEMKCKKRGYKVIYFSRGLPKDEERLISSLETSIDRYMAAEHSRKLSDDVWHGSVKVTEQGFSAGGTAPYGYARALFDERRNRVGTLEPGEHKVISNQRIMFEPVKTGEVEVIKRIFHEFTKLGYSPNEIVNGLNNDGILTAKRKVWNSSGVIRILTNETYTGTRIYNKTWSRLKKKKRANPPEEWVRCLGAHDALVDLETFYAAQKRLFWLRPRIHNRHLLQIYGARVYMYQFIDAVIENYSEDQRHYIQKYLPVAFAVPHKVNDEKQAYFHIPNKHRKYDRVICVELDIDSEEASKIKHVYKMNTDSLSNKSYVLLTNDFALEPLMQKELSSLILELADSVLSIYAPWLLNIEQPSYTSKPLLNASNLEIA